MRIYSAKKQAQRLLSILDLILIASERKSQFEALLKRYDDAGVLDPIVITYRRTQLVDDVSRMDKVIFRLKMAYLSTLNKLTNL